MDSYEEIVAKSELIANSSNKVALSNKPFLLANAIFDS